MDSKIDSEITDDVNFNCEPDCPMLSDGICMKSGNKLDWYDFWIAECLEDSDLDDK